MAKGWANGDSLPTGRVLCDLSRLGGDNIFPNGRVEFVVPLAGEMVDPKISLNLLPGELGAAAFRAGPAHVSHLGRP